MIRVILICLLLSTPAWAGPWVALNPVELVSPGGTASIELGETFGKIDNIRFQLDGATVEFLGVTAISSQGTAIALKTPGILKSGEGSGLINIPGQALQVESLKLGYRVVSGRAGIVSIRVKTD
ncbi:MAG: hypothetical protein EOL86_01450 [Deltaproteobacteria bacterium]|nr:hypothetical protein [Deltaproteobacteria bacterium]